MKQSDPKTNATESISTSEQGLESTPVTKVLAVINDNAAFNTPLTYLRKKEFKVKVVHSLMEGIRELTDFKPEILLLSWSLKGTDIKKVHPVLTQKFSAICLILGEDDSTNTTAAMISSGIPNTILAPVGGVNLYNKIQSALGRSASNNKSKDRPKRTRTKEKTLLGGIEYKRPKKNEIPADTVWKIRVNSTNPANQIWETILYKNGKPQYLYYKGDRPPDKWLNSKEDGPGDHSYIFMSEAQASAELLSSFHDYSETNMREPEDEELENLEDLEAEGVLKAKPEDSVLSENNASKLLKTKTQENSSKDPSAKNAENSVTKEYSTQTALSTKREKDDKSSSQDSILNKEITTQDSPNLLAKDLNSRAAVDSKIEVKSQTLLEKSVNTAIELALKDEVKSFEAPILIDAVSNLTVSVIKNHRFKGYLVSGQANDVSNPKFMKKVFNNLNDEMRRQNEALSALCGVLELKLKPIPFKKWMQERAEFTIQSQLGTEEIVFAFVPAEELPQNFIEEDLVPIPIEAFEEDKVLYFDIYLHMPVNQKHVLYLKNGSEFKAASKNRLLEHNIRVIYVKKSDENLFFAYSARNTIERMPVNRSVPLMEAKKVA